MEQKQKNINIKRNNMFFTVANHNDAKNSKGFINYDDVEFTDIPEMVMSGFAYSAGKFKDNHRKNENWIGCEDVLILDVDDGCTIEQASILFIQYEHYIITTRSHQKDKNGLVCDRFRIFIHLENTLNNIKIRHTFIKNIMDMYFFVDKSCKDCGRFFFSSPSDAIVIYNKGIKYKVNNVQIDFKVPTTQKQAQSNTITQTRGIYRLCELRECWINEYGETLEYESDGLNIEAKLRGALTVLDNEFYSGNRANCIFKVSAMLKKDGLSDDDISNFLIKENNKRDGLHLNELMQNIKSGLRR